jgi:predicted amino acid-binding ACT domain protein
MSLTDLLYGGGELAAPSPEAPSPVPPADDEVRRFIAEARLALRGGVARWLVCVVASDRVGLVAAVSRALAERQLNVEAAHQMTAGGQAILSFTVSSDGKPLTKADLIEALDLAGIEWDASAYVLDAAPVEQPIPVDIHTRWFASLTGDARNHTERLASIAASVGERDWPIVALNSFVVEDRFDLEMTFATSSDVSANTAAEPLLEVDRKLRLRLATDQLGVSADLLRQSPMISAPNDGLLWVTGIARPGLLARVFKVVGETGSAVSVVSMAILEGHTVALIGVDVAPGIRPVELGRKIEKSATDAELRAEHLRSSISSTRPVDASLQLYSVHAITEERAGVIAEIAERIARLGGDICRIRSRVVGTSRPADCEVQLAVWLPPARLDDLTRDLEKARDFHGWATCFIEPFGPIALQQ